MAMKWDDTPKVADKPQDKRGTGYWTVRLTGLVDGVKKTTDVPCVGAKSRDDAEQFRRKLADEMKKGTWQASDDVTLVAWTEERIAAHLGAGDIDTTTASNYRSRLKCAIAPHFRTIKLQSVTSRHVEQFRAGMSAAKKAKSTITLSMAVLSIALNDALNSVPPLLAINPMKGVKRQRHDDGQEPQYKDRAIPRERMELLWRHFRGHEYEDLLRFLYQTGTRRGEALGLCWDKLNLDTGLLEIRRQLRNGIDGTSTELVTKLKTKQSRRDVYLADDTVAMLRRRHAEAIRAVLATGRPFDPKALVFGDQNPHRVTEWFIAECAKVGIKAKLHDLRHTFCTQCIETGMDVNLLSKIVGHSDVAFTIKHYQTVSEANKKQAATHIGRAMRIEEPVVSGCAGVQVGVQTLSLVAK
jgi:integrase